MIDKVKFSSYVQKHFKTNLSKLAKNKSKANNSYHSKYTTINDYSKRFNEATLNAICHKITQQKYVCNPLTPIILPKEDNLKRHSMTIENTRLVCVPAVQDRILQRLFIKYLKEYYGEVYKKFCEYDHALNTDFNKKEIDNVDKEGQPVKGTISGIRKALDDVIEYRNKYKCVIKADIVKFFDNINREIAVKKFAREFIGVREDKELIAIFTSFIYCDANLDYGEHNYRGLIKTYLTELKGKGIRQGMPIASLCSSMYLYEFDNLMVQDSVPYIRYADDFLIFSDSYKEADKLKKEVQRFLKNIKLDIEKSGGVQKTQIYGSKINFSYLGFDVVYCFDKQLYTLKIPQEIFDTTKKKMHSFNTMSKVKRKLKKKANYASLTSYFDQLILGYTSYYSEDLAINGRAFKLHLIQESENVRKKLITDNLDIDFHNIGSANKSMFFFNIK